MIATCLYPETLLAKHEFGPNVEILKLDVTDETAVLRLAEQLKNERIDILINNAGIPGPHVSLEDTDIGLWRRMLDVNLIGPFVVSQAFIEQVARSDQKVIAFVSSRMGSIGLNNTGMSYDYRSSKAGLNMVMKSSRSISRPAGFAPLAFIPATCLSPAMPVWPQPSALLVCGK